MLVYFYRIMCQCGLLSFIHGIIFIFLSYVFCIFLVYVMVLYLVQQYRALTYVFININLNSFHSFRCFTIRVYAAHLIHVSYYKHWIHQKGLLNIHSKVQDSPDWTSQNPFMATNNENI